MMRAEDYEKAFGIHANSKRAEAALQQAIDSRKFEAQIGWTRTSYFWTFLGSGFAAYGAIQALNSGRTRTDLSVVLSCLGLVFSFAWYCVNRGSKHWQENWEDHVDLLEDAVTGPLHKTVLSRPKATTLGRAARLLNGPAAYSVSRINQLVSIYIIAMWLVLLIHALPPISRAAPVSPLYTASIVLSAIACALIATLGRSQEKDYEVEATIRSARLRTTRVEDALAGSERIG